MELKEDKGHELDSKILQRRAKKGFEKDHQAEMNVINPRNSAQASTRVCTLQEVSTSYKEM